MGFIEIYNYKTTTLAPITKKVKSTIASLLTAKKEQVLSSITTLSTATLNEHQNQKEMNEKLRYILIGVAILVLVLVFFCCCFCCFLGFFLKKFPFFWMPLVGRRRADPQLGILKFMNCFSYFLISFYNLNCFKKIYESGSQLEAKLLQILLNLATRRVTTREVTTKEVTTREVTTKRVTTKTEVEGRFDT